jgi:DNA-binding GntR family transcriptional regulator
VRNFFLDICGDYCILTTKDNTSLTLKMETLAITGVTDTILHQLRVHIIDRRIPPGKKLNEVELSSSLGVSRPPLREAFRMLENEHLITSIPRKGSYVSEMSIDDCQEIFEAREMIECFAVELLQKRGIRELPKTSSTLALTRRLRMPKTSDPFDKYNYLKAIAEFHISLVEASGNSRLIRSYQAIFHSLARYQDMYVFVPGLMDKSQAAHEQILHLIQKGNYEKAKEKLRSHIRRYSKTTEEKLRNSQD